MRYDFDYTHYLAQLLPLLQNLLNEPVPTGGLSRLLTKFAKPEGGIFTKNQLLVAFHQLKSEFFPEVDEAVVLTHLQTKPIRTQSGVTPVTVLTKPYPCPGRCIFCPSDIRMPKSYLSDEPGAQRAERNFFDPYLQTYQRLAALQNIGHQVGKVELIILGGTWSDYPTQYQIWFIRECFRAVNDFGHDDDRQRIRDQYHQRQRQFSSHHHLASSDQPQLNARRFNKYQIKGQHLDKTYNQIVSQLYVAPEKILGLDKYQTATWSELMAEQLENETATQRCVGLVVETRPDNITALEVVKIRRLGVTKVQIGVQSLNDRVLRLNHRGHSVAATRRAFQLLRQAGFKIHAHWMANLYGSSVLLDQQDFARLFSDPDFCPDELKIYPCSLIASAELMKYYQAGQWWPYTHQELLTVVGYVLTATPAYCRLTRIIRDIPSTDIVTGNKLTNFRQIAEAQVISDGRQLQEIRSREIRRQVFDPRRVRLSQLSYPTSVSQEIFIQLTVKTISHPMSLVAFLRLSLPSKTALMAELAHSAIIREIHVYGQSLVVGVKSKSAPQHQGFGRRLLARAIHLTRRAGFNRLAVISAVGTREYYRHQGFTDGELYQFLDLRTLSRPRHRPQLPSSDD